MTKTNTTFLISLSVFDDRTIGAWSSVHDGHVSPIQHIGRMDAARWADVFGSILPSDDVRIAVTDRTSCWCGCGSLQHHQEAVSESSY
jgi:hypothetical protein